MVTLGFPHEPEFEDVHLAATLDRLVSSVEGHVVKLVLLEQVRGIGAMTLLEHTLERGTRH